MQSSRRLPCHLCGNCSIQDNRDVYTIPNGIPAHLFWAYMGSNCRAFVPSDDHAFGSCKTIFSAQVFQRGTPSGFRCSRV